MEYSYCGLFYCGVLEAEGVLGVRFVLFSIMRALSVSRERETLTLNADTNIKISGCKFSFLLRECGS